MGAEILQERKAGWVYALTWIPVVMVYAVAFAADGTRSAPRLRTLPARSTKP